MIVSSMATSKRPALSQQNLFDTLFYRLPQGHYCQQFFLATIQPTSAPKEDTERILGHASIAFHDALLGHLVATLPRCVAKVV